LYIYFHYAILHPYFVTPGVYKVVSAKTIATLSVPGVSLFYILHIFFYYLIRHFKAISEPSA